MGDEYQNRRDIDKIYDDLYDQINGSLNVLKFDKDSEFKNISSKEDGSDVGTIDAIINYYQLTEKGGGSGDLSEYVRKDDLIDNTKYDIDLNLDFGLKGQDDTIVIDMDIVDYIVDKEINLRGV